MFDGNKSSLEDKEVLIGFVDFHFARWPDTRKSLTGYVFTAFGIAISWKASLQKVAALSTTEAKYIALTKAIKEAIWLLGLIKELKVGQDQVAVYCDT